MMSVVAAARGWLYLFTSSPLDAREGSWFGQHQLNLWNMRGAA